MTIGDGVGPFHKRGKMGGAEIISHELEANRGRRFQGVESALCGLDIRLEAGVHGYSDKAQLSD